MVASARASSSAWDAASAAAPLPLPEPPLVSRDGRAAPRAEIEADCRIDRVRAGVGAGAVGVEEVDNVLVGVEDLERAALADAGSGVPPRCTGIFFVMVVDIDGGV